MSIPTITPLIYPSSAEFWKSSFPTHYNYAFNTRALTNLPPEYKVTATAALSTAERFSLTTPLSLIPSSINRTHVGKYYICHWQKAGVPPNSFFKIPNLNIYVACPELTFLHAARHLSFASLVQLGFELCSQYYADQSERFGQARRTLVTTSEQIIAYAKASNHISGCAKALHAAKYVLNDSNSPMETRLAIMLELPIRLGGYGLGELEMNGAISLSKHGRELIGTSEIRGDLVWRKKRLAVEYNSKTVHNNDVTYYNDNNRDTALKDSGWQYIGVTPDNIKTFSSMENIAEIIRRQLGRRAKKELLSSYEKERQRVYNELFKKSE